MTDTNRRVIFAKRPEGWVTPDCFRVEDAPIPELDDGDVLTRNIVMSVDPYMRGRMSDRKSYTAGFQLGETMTAGAVGEIIASRNASLPVGTVVNGMLGWETHTLVKGGGGLLQVDPAAAPLSWYLGILGMPGFTGWYGLLKIGNPKPGETVFVSAASGAVGQVVGQIAKIKGARVVGTAGDDDKCAWAVESCGYDVCFNYKTVGDIAAAVREHCPDGIDIDFENVGGEILDAVLANLNPYARIALCGLISQYNLVKPEGIHNFQQLLLMRARVQGFIISEHFEMRDEFISDMTGWLRAGKLQYRESFTDGIDSAPGALIGVLKGENFGKQIVRIGADPS